jgi:hypothetical protein
MVADFSAMHNLYGVVGNVNDVSRTASKPSGPLRPVHGGFSAGNSRGDRFGSIRRRCPGSREAVVLRSDAAVTHGAGLQCC